MKTFTILVPIIAVIALVGLGLGVVGLTKSDNDGAYQQRIAALQLKVNQLQVRTDQLQSLAGQMDTTSIQTRLTKLINCIPEIQAQLDGLQVNSGYFSNAPGFNGDIAQYPVTLQNNTIISRDCQGLLRPAR
jgi:hypothetical protein